MQQIWGVASTNCEAQAQILDMLQTWGKKVTVTQGKTRTQDLANVLPCSNQLSYRVTQQLSG